MSSKKPTRKTFKETVELTKDIATCYQPGLTALGAHSKRISVPQTEELCGSVDIDSCTARTYPQSNRWDYIICYKNEVYFVEIHSANSGEVRTMSNKLRWLKDWLNTSAPEIKKLQAKNTNPFVWIQSKGFDIPKTSPQYRTAKGLDILPVRRLDLN